MSFPLDYLSPYIHIWIPLLNEMGIFKLTHNNSVWLISQCIAVIAVKTENWLHSSKKIIVKEKKKQTKNNLTNRNTQEFNNKFDPVFFPFVGHIEWQMTRVYLLMLMIVVECSCISMYYFLINKVFIYLNSILLESVVNSSKLACGSKLYSSKKLSLL